MSYKKQIIVHSLIGGMLILLLVVATFLDQKVAEYAYIGEGISVIGTVLGKLPAWIFFVMASTILFRSGLSREKRDKMRITLVIIYTMMIFGGAMMLGYSIVEDIIDDFYKYLVAGLIGGCVIILALMMSTKLTPDMVSRLKKWAIMAIIAVGVIVVLTAGIKLMWGRARYMEILTGDNTFTPWYQPRGLTGGTSMPSGHTSLAAAMFLLPLMFVCMPKMTAYAPTGAALALLFVIFVATTRVIGGYHFMSDVVISTIIAYLTISICGYIFFGRTLSNTTISEGNFLNKL